MDYISSVTYEIYKQVFYCKRSVQKLLFADVSRKTVSPKHIPWLWVGAKFVDRSDPVSYTEIVNNYIWYGDVVTKEYLNSMAELDDEFIETWYYVDAETLEEKEIPPEGLVIENDTEE